MEGSVSVQVCKTWVQNADGTVGCTHLEWIQTYLLPPEAEGYLTLLMVVSTRRPSASASPGPSGCSPLVWGWLDHFRHAQSAQLMRFQSWKNENPVPQRFHRHRRPGRGQRLLRRIAARRNHQGVLAQASTDGGSVAKLVIAAVAVLVGLALVIGAMRKA